MDISLINENYPWIFTICFFLVGACIGSFLNVCILRIPKGESISTPPSHCVCGKPIKFYDNIPILSWFILRGRARCCGVKISPRYFMVELLTALIFAYMWYKFSPDCAIAGMIFASIMIFCTFVDVDTMMLPDSATIGGTILGVIVSTAIPNLHGVHFTDYPFAVSAIASFISAVIGVVVGSGILYWLRILGQVAFRKEAMGEGDVLLLGCIGAFCGWQGAVFAIFGGSLIGSIIMIPSIMLMSLFKKKEEHSDDDMQGAIPFGPWLALGGVLYFLFFRESVAQYFQNITQAFF